MKIIRLVPVVDLNVAQKATLLQIRNLSDVRRLMFTDHIIGDAEHAAWIDRLRTDATKQVYAVTDAGAVLGLISLYNIDALHKKADWAFYLAPEARGGLGTALEYRFLDYAFGEAGLQKMNNEVLDSNDAVRRLHYKFGFKPEGIRRQNILKGGQRIDVHLLGITVDEWRTEQPLIAAKYADLLASFDIQFNAHSAWSDLLCPGELDAKPGKEFWDKYNIEIAEIQKEGST